MDRYSHTCIHTRAHAPVCVQVRFRADEDTAWRLQLAEVRCGCHTERTHARTHSATVCVCLYRARKHTVPQAHTRNRTQYDEKASDEEEAGQECSEDDDSENEGEVSERLGRSARRVSLRA